MTLPILLLAAGASARMRGEDKLMRPIGGQPLLRDRAETALATGAALFVTLPVKSQAPDRWQALEGLARCTLLPVPDAGQGLSASLRAGLSALPASAPGVLVMLADMPDITRDDLAALMAPFDGTRLVRAVDEAGKPGNPVILPARLFARASTLSGDTGARALMAEEDPLLVALPGQNARTDLDTPEDWQAWQALRSAPPRRD